MQVREENSADIDEIRRIHRAAFPTPEEAELVDRLRDNGNAVVSLVAEEQGALVGHVLLSPVQVENAPQAKGLGLAPVAVVPEYQGFAVGTRLIERAIEQARALGFDFIVVLGDPGYYGRFGFEAASRFGLGNEYQVNEPFRVLALQPAGVPINGGLVRYGPEFGLLGH